MIYGTLFTLPNSTSTLANIGAWSSPLMDDFLPLIYPLVAIMVIAVIIGVIIKILHK